jgi:hypothetical protein
LNEILPEFLEKISRDIVIIGNAPYDLGLPLGEFIDSFEDVMRFNNFSVREHEKYVGSKTTIWCYFNCNFKLYKRNFQKPKGHSMELIVMRHRGWLPKHLRNDKSGLVVEKIEHEAAKKLNNPPIELGGSQRKFPSTGILAVDWAVSKGRKPLVIGFNGFMNKGSKHYWESHCERHIGFGKEHGVKEIQFLKGLHQEGKICFLDFARRRITMM